MKDRKLDDEKDLRKRVQEKDEEYIRHLEKNPRNLETEKQLLDAERLRFDRL